MSGTIGNIIAQESFDWVATTTSSSVVPLAYRRHATIFNDFGFTTGVYEGYALNVSGGSNLLFTELLAHSAGFFCCHVKINGAAWNETIFSFTTNDGSKIFGVRFYHGTQKIEIQNASGVAVATSTGTYAKDQWYWMNIKYNIADSGGEVTVRLDNAATTDFVTWTGDTKSGANSNIYRVYLESTYSPCAIDNVIMHQPGTYLSERRMSVQRATGDSSYATDFVPSTGVSNYAMVDDITPSLTDYVSSTTVGNIDLYTRGAVSIEAIDSVTYCTLAAKTDVGNRELAHVTRTSGINYETAGIPVSATPFIYETHYTTNPATGVAWVTSDVNATEFGFKDKA